MTTTITWTQKLDGLTGRVAEVKDAYETYYAEVGDMTEEQVEDAFVAAYDFSDEGTPEALRRELQVFIADASKLLTNGQTG